MSDRRATSLSLLVLCLGFFCRLPTPGAAEVTVATLLSAPDHYDQQEVTLTGMAQAVKPTASRRGNPYTTFQLADTSGKAVTVFTWGHPMLNNGDRVEVTGIFQRVKRVGQYVEFITIKPSVATA